mmetsp:Transcript_37182/g.115717  ORF Transcript_37182/g.115717 Transcript_37182/m.115717 type:complete len:315 (-) Transcript_37182:1396-2340(-)
MHICANFRRSALQTVLSSSGQLLEPAPAVRACSDLRMHDQLLANVLARRADHDSQLRLRDPALLGHCRPVATLEEAEITVAEVEEDLRHLPWLENLGLVEGTKHHGVVGFELEVDLHDLGRRVHLVLIVQGDHQAERVGARCLLLDLKVVEAGVRQTVPEGIGGNKRLRPIRGDLFVPPVLLLLAGDRQAQGQLPGRREVAKQRRGPCGGSLLARVEEAHDCLHAVTPRREHRSVDLHQDNSLGALLRGFTDGVRGLIVEPPMVREELGTSNHDAHVSTLDLLLHFHALHLGLHDEANDWGDVRIPLDVLILRP